MNRIWRSVAGFAALALIMAACNAAASPTPPSGTVAPSVAPAGSASPTTASLAGVTLHLAAESDQYAAVLAKLAPEFQQATGGTVVVDILGYPEEYSKITADFVGHTANYDLVTTDIVWSGEFAMNQYTVDLTSLIQRDKAEINTDDIYPVMWNLGEWEGKQIAFPMAGYANLLNYNKTMFDAAGLQAPTTMDELKTDAQKLTDASKNQYGITINGQKGAAGAQDFFVYNAQLGGHLLDANNKPTLNSAENVANLTFFASLFQFAPPGAFDYDWGARETAFKTGIAAMQEGWSVARSGYEDASQSKIVGQVGTVVAPTAAGMAPTYGFGGWGIGINKDSKNQDAAWTYIKWLTSPAIQKEWVLDGSGSYIRKSTLSDPDLVAKYPFQTFIANSFEKGDGNFRPRIPQYSQMQDAMGTAVNEVLHGTMTPQAALDAAQAQVAPLFP
jgi:multiple sugar transport system substrate-binding protein